MNADWLPFVMRWDDVTSGELDLSFLNHCPAGKHGFIKAQAGHLVAADSGERVRFFGVNLVFAAGFPTHAQAEVVAKRLAHAGVNMVRFHHCDSKSGFSYIDYSRGNSRSLQEEAMDRWDYLVWQLKQHGIYIHIDLFTLRSFLPGDDVPTPAELAAGQKHVTFVNRRLIDLHKEFSRNLLLHMNRYTGLRGVDEPAIAIVQLVNENSLFWTAWKNPPAYMAEIDQLWNHWLLEQYHDRNSLAQAWTNSAGECCLGADEDPLAGTVGRPTVGSWHERALPPTRPNTGLDAPSRFYDHQRFLCDLQNKYFAEQEAHLRQLGLKCAINGSNLANGVTGLYSQTNLDVTEGNCYWNHPQEGFNIPAEFHRYVMVNSDPHKHYNKGFTTNMVTHLCSMRVAGKPYVVTEWNTPYPAEHRSDAMLYLSAYAALQDWDGLLLFSYAHSSYDQAAEQNYMAGFFNSWNDPMLWGAMQAAALLFRRGDVQKARHVVDICFPGAEAYAAQPQWNRPFRTLPFLTGVRMRYPGEKYGATKPGHHADVALHAGSLPVGDYTAAEHAILFAHSPWADPYQKHMGRDQWLQAHAAMAADKKAVLVAGDPQNQAPGWYERLVLDVLQKWGVSPVGYADVQAGVYSSDTGELHWNSDSGVFCIDAPNVQGAVGFTAGKRVECRSIITDIATKFSCVMVSGLDGPISGGGRLLVTALGRAANQDMRWEGNVLVDNGHGPVVVEPVQGRVLLRFPVDADIQAYALDQRGAKLQQVPVRWEETEHVWALTMAGDVAAIHYAISVRISSRKGRSRGE